MENGIVLESVWVAVGFVVFVALAWRKISTALTSMLDERSEKIAAELKEASSLRDEALAELLKLSAPPPGSSRRSQSDNKIGRSVGHAHPRNCRKECLGRDQAARRSGRC